MKAMWDTCPLGDLADFKNGLNYTRNSGGTTLPVVGVGDFAENFYAPLFQLETATIDGELDSNYQLKENDILIVRSNGSKALVGRSMLVPAVTGAVSYSGFVIRVRITRDSVDPTFVLHFLKSPDTRDRLTLSGGGANISNINQQSLSTLRIPVPPLAEQQRIVGILDEAFEGIATAKANAEKNLQNARALFESHLQSVFAEAWHTCTLVTLSDLATDISDGDHMPPPKAETGVPFITIGNIIKNTRTIDFADTFMVPDKYFRGLKASKRPKAGDVLYTVTGSFGIPVILRDSKEFCFQRHIGLVRPKPETNSDWLYYLLLSPQVFTQAAEGATGTAQKTVSLRVLRNFQVPRVAIDHQIKDASKLAAISHETQRLATIYERKLAALDDLKKSLLHQAFSGEL